MSFVRSPIVSALSPLDGAQIGIWHSSGTSSWAHRDNRHTSRSRIAGADESAEGRHTRGTIEWRRKVVRSVGRLVGLFSWILHTCVIYEPHTSLIESSCLSHSQCSDSSLCVVLSFVPSFARSISQQPRFSRCLKLTQGLELLLHIIIIITAITIQRPWINFNRQPAIHLTCSSCAAAPQRWWYSLPIMWTHFPLLRFPTLITSVASI